MSKPRAKPLTEVEKAALLDMLKAAVGESADVARLHRRLQEHFIHEDMLDGALIPFLVTQSWNGGTAGVAAGTVDNHGELELTLHVNGHEGKCFLSKEMWEAFGQKAGWV